MAAPSTVLEIAGGVVSLLSFCLFVWLIEHLRCEFKYRDLTWRDAVLLLPSVSIACALLLYNLGGLITRGTAWIWRAMGANTPFSTTQNYLLLVGSLLTASGLLWMIAILSKPRYGEWPWRASAALAGTYAVLTIAWRLGGH